MGSMKGWTAILLAPCLAGAVQAEEPRITTRGTAVPVESWDSPSERIVPPSSQVTIRRQHGVTIIAPVRRPPPRQSLVPAGDSGEDIVVYADGSTASRRPAAAVRETSPTGFALRRPGRAEVIDLPGYGPRMVIFR